MYQSKAFKIQMNGNNYNINLDYSIVRDEHDRDVIHSIVDEDSILIEDEEGNVVTEDHEDFEDLMEDVLARDYEPSHWELAG